MTKTRQALLAIFRESTAPLSMAQLKEKLLKKGCKPNKTTVYRALESFLAQGLLVQVDLGDRVGRYETTQRKHHHHAVCVRCSKVDDVELSETLLSLPKQKLQRKGFEALSHSLEFFGLCTNCRA